MRGVFLLRSCFFLGAFAAWVVSASAQQPVCFTDAEDPCKGDAPSVSADFLYWYAEQDGNSYASTGAAITVPETTDPNTELPAGAVSSAGAVYSPHPSLSPGFRASLGWSLSDDHWELFCEYTFLFTKTEDEIDSNSLNTGIVPLFSYIPHNSILASTIAVASTGGTGFVSEASSHWSLQFNSISLELEKALALSKRFSLSPHFGLIGSWQTQKVRTAYEVSSFTAPEVFLGSNRTVFKQLFWGFGPRVGFDFTWRCSDWLSLYMNTGGGLLWGAFSANAKAYDTNVNSGYSDVLIANQNNLVHTLSPMAQLAIGFSSNWTIKQTAKLTARAGWETQTWLFQNQHSSSIADDSLILQGLTAGLSLDF